MDLQLPWNPPKRATQTIFPVFIPFFGCKIRCIFCAQDVQSGTAPKSITDILTGLEHDLQLRQKENKPQPELGFFGGTFTALDTADFKLCCDFVKKQLKEGRIVGARCSTRPDALNENILSSLKNSGFNMIELGIQSFNTKALQCAKRGYDNYIAIKACHLIVAHDLKLGVQLMPGMPGVNEEIFLQDVHKALDLNADILRFYPCQVIAGTALATLWANNQYEPWNLNTTINTLSKAWLMALEKQVPVIRMGLAPQAELDAAILAGPRHEALGGLVMGQALFDYVSKATSQKLVKYIRLPNTCQGFFAGDKNSLIPLWNNCGISKNNILWHDKNYIEIEYL